jgi:hypothetical protein
MPIGKKSGGDNTLYALIAFVALFIIATALAVICYLKFEEQRGLAEAAQKKLNDVASAAEVQKIGTLVGAEQPGKSRLKVALGYLDQAVGLIVPGEPEETSAEIKVNGAAAKVQEAVAAIAEQNPEFSDLDPNAALLQITDKLSTTLQNTRTAEEAAKEQLATLQNRFDDAMRASLEKEQALLAEKDKFQQQFEKARGDYDELKALLEKKTEEQVKDLYGKLDQEKTTREEINRQLLKSRAELQAAHDRIQRILKEGVLPAPDAEARVFEPDGKVLLIDDQAKIVHINLGSDDHVYVGLTFSVYDKSLPIPKNGKGKAEIEVYNVDKNIAAARIIRADIKNPIGVDDVVANLAWDAKKTNVFVVAGDFDLNGDGVIDVDGVEKIRKLIEKWGGKVDDAVTVNTDFVVLGVPPEVRQKPTLAETEVYPNATEKHDRAVEQLANYKKVQSQAEVLSIPILNADRFLYFIGYKTQAGKPGAF